MIASFRHPPAKLIRTPAHAPGDKRLDRVLRNPQTGGYVFLRKSMYLPKKQHLTATRRKRLHRLGKEHLFLSELYYFRDPRAFSRRQ